MGNRDRVFWNGVGWVSGVFTILGLMLAFAYFGTAEAREHGRNLTEDPKYLECESYLKSVPGVNSYAAVRYCLDLHSGRTPQLCRVGGLAALHDAVAGQAGFHTQEEFRRRYMTFGLAKVPDINRKFYQD